MKKSEALIIVEISTAVREILRMMVNEPDAVGVVLLKRGDAAVLDVSVAERDIGRVIGYKGRTAMSLRTIVSSMCLRQQVKVELRLPA